MYFIRYSGMFQGWLMFDAIKCEVITGYDGQPVVFGDSAAAQLYIRELAA